MRLIGAACRIAIRAVSRNTGAMCRGRHSARIFVAATLVMTARATPNDNARNRHCRNAAWTRRAVGMNYAITHKRESALKMPHAIRIANAIALMMVEIEGIAPTMRSAIAAEEIAIRCGKTIVRVAAIVHFAMRVTLIVRVGKPIAAISVGNAAVEVVAVDAAVVEGDADEKFMVFAADVNCFDCLRDCSDFADGAAALFNAGRGSRGDGHGGET